jgi:hypothetical protein
VTYVQIACGLFIVAAFVAAVIDWHAARKREDTSPRSERTA